MIKERGSGKVILFGEHFVVYGVPGIAAGIDRGVEVSVKESSEDKIVGEWNTEGTRKAVDAIKKKMGIEGHIEIGVKEEIPTKAGLGASAAFSVGLTKAVAKLFNKKIEEEEVFSTSLEAEKIYHGNPSGIDNAAATYGGLIKFIKGKGIERLDIGKELNIVVSFTGKKGSTKELVEGVKKVKERNEGVFEKLLSSYVELYKEGENALKQGNIEKIGELMNINHGLLSAIGVSTKENEEVAHIAREEGALGSKITGAGGGGCNIALVRDESEAGELAHKLERRGFRSFPARIGG
ncbi:MAG: mevalonate kinase [Methanobacteriota archaeon]|nr:MAG: mevalonate kinase [Euryarchaeota archaeon]